MRHVLVQWPAQAASGVLSAHSLGGQRAQMAPLTKKQDTLQVLSREYLQSLHATGTTSQMSPSVIRPGATMLSHGTQACHGSS